MDKNAFLSVELNYGIAFLLEEGILPGWFQKINTGLNIFILFYTAKYNVIVNRFLILWFLIFLVFNCIL